MRFWITSLLCLFSAQCFAVGLAVQPMEQYVRPGQSASYHAINQQDKALAVEIFAEEWSISEDGTEVRVPTNDLVIFPSQFILKGNTSKLVKVGVRSKKPIKHEKAYRVTIRELPVSFEVDDDEKTHVYMANAYRTSYYVLPRKKSSQLELRNAHFHDGVLNVRFENTGTVHDYFHNPSLSLTLDDGQTIEVDNETVMKSIAGQNMHAQSTRSFALDLTELNLTSSIQQAVLKLRDQNESDSQSFDLLF